MLSMSLNFAHNSILPCKVITGEVIIIMKLTYQSHCFHPSVYVQVFTCIMQDEESKL